mgnify:CR=1 FL=1
MAWGTQEQKGDLAKMGLEALISFTKSMTDESRRIELEAKENIKNINDEELNDVLLINAKLSNWVNNLLTDAELGCKFKRTEEIFLEIIRVIMYDKEKDYQEMISNFTKAIDNEEFITSHDLAVKKREERLDKEYEDEMKSYEIKMTKYRQQNEDYNSKNFLSKMFSNVSKPILPNHPIRRT